ncbi:MAG: SusC/RagA family, partial [Mucilaginibacter sp.]|nr:SusC/RagA family [Mucilaginibacter sp.]
MRKTITFLFIFLLSGMSIAFAQNLTVKGKVSDNTGTALPGVTVKVKGAQAGATVTDVNGNYSISAPQGGTLAFTYVGYTEKSIAITGQNVINITLEANTTGLDE